MASVSNIAFTLTAVSIYFSPFLFYFRCGHTVLIKSSFTSRYKAGLNRGFSALFTFRAHLSFSTNFSILYFLDAHLKIFSFLTFSWHWFWYIFIVIFILYFYKGFILSSSFESHVHTFSFFFIVSIQLTMSQLFVIFNTILNCYMYLHSHITGESLDKFAFVIFLCKKLVKGGNYYKLCWKVLYRVTIPCW